MKKVILLFTLILSLSLLLAACGGGEEPTPEPPTAEPTALPATVAPTATPEPPTPEPPTPEPAPTVAAAETVIVAPAVASAEGQEQVTAINVGVNAEFEPFVYMDADGNLAGFDIDLMNALSTAAGFEIVYVGTAFDTIFDSLVAGDFDAAISAITITEPRREKVDFSETYFATAQMPLRYMASGQGIAVLTETMDINGLEDLTPEKAVGVKRGTTGARFVADESAAQVAVFLEAEPALQAVVAGDVDAAVLDIPVIMSFIKANPNAAIKISAGPLTEEEYGIAVNKARPDVLAALNGALAQIEGDGTYDAIFQKWFGAP